MEIRTATKEDTKELIALNMEVHDLHVELEPSVFREISEESISQQILRSLGDKHSSIIVATKDQVIVGYALLQRRTRPAFDMMYERKCVYIDQVCVKSQHRNRGVLKMLLETAKKLALEWGFNRLELDVWSNNINAKGSFTKSGFVTYNEKMKIDL